MQELHARAAERQEIIDELKTECESRLEKMVKLDTQLRAIHRGGPLKRAARWVKRRVFAALGKSAPTPS